MAELSRRLRGVPLWVIFLFVMGFGFTFYMNRFWKVKVHG